MRTHNAWRVFFCLLALLLLTTCGALLREGYDVQAVELLHFNGQNETWAYRMDSVGRVQVLHLNVDTRDSAVHCFALSEPRRRHVLTLVQAVLSLDSIGTGGIRIEPSDRATAKVVVYRKGRPVFSFCNQPISEYADPNEMLFYLVHALREADASHREPSPCAGAFSAPVLAQGLEELFYFPRPDTLPADTTQE